jgi:Ulp1 family protease
MTFPFGDYDDILQGYGKDKLTMFCTDLDKLEPTVFLNDNLIDFKIFHILLNLSPKKRDAVHSLGCLFYCNVQTFHLNQKNRYNKMLRDIIRTVNIFAKDLILIPINVHKSMHWSLCIVVRPLQYLLHHFISDEEKSKYSIICEENPQRGCILHMNSYPGVHLQAQVFKEINEFLSELWMLQIHDGSFSASLNDYLRKYGLSVSENVDIVGLVNTQINKCGITSIFESCPTVVCKITKKQSKVKSVFFIFK